MSQPFSKQDDRAARTRIPVLLKCPNCKQTGHAMWEEDTLPTPHGLSPSLISLPDGFSRRARAGVAATPEIVCDKCGTALLE